MDSHSHSSQSHSSTEECSHVQPHSQHSSAHSQSPLHTPCPVSAHRNHIHAKDDHSHSHNSERDTYDCDHGQSLIHQDQTTKSNMQTHERHFHGPSLQIDGSEHMQLNAVPASPSDTLSPITPSYQFGYDDHLESHHKDYTHAHSQGHEGHSHNMRGVFLHVMAVRIFSVASSIRLNDFHRTHLVQWGSSSRLC